MRLRLSFLRLLAAIAAFQTTAAFEESSDDDDSNRDKSGPNPDVILGATLAGAGLAAIMAPAMFVGPALAAIGFGPLGPVAGALRLAPVLQAATGPVAAGGLFATLQSAAMGGYGVGAVNLFVQGVGGAMATVGGALTGAAAATDEKKADEKKAGEEKAGEEKAGEKKAGEKKESWWW